MRFLNLFGLGAGLLSYATCPVSAQELNQCATQCFGAAVQAQTECSGNDIPCICANAPLQAAIKGCVLTKCTVKEGLAAVKFTSSMCGAPIRNRSAIIAWVSGVSGVMALLTIIVRVIVAITNGSYGWDDTFAILAWAFALPLTILQSITPHLGFGQDTWMVNPKNIYIILQMIYASQVGYFLCSGFTKLCFLFFYLRIFPDESTRKRIFVFIGLSLVYTLAFDLTMIFACKPISAIWTSWDGEHHIDYCIDQNKFFYVAAAMNITVDIGILIIPIPELLKLELSLRRKIFLLTIFSVGSLTIVVSCIRVQSLAQYAASQNPLYDNLNSGIFSVLEANVGVVCICMPAFRRFLARLVPKCFGTTEDGSLYKNEDETPNSRISNGKLNHRFRKSTLPGSLFDTNLTKTVDTKTDSRGSDDEVQLMELQETRKGNVPSTRSMEGDDSMKHTNTTSQDGTLHVL